MIAARKKFDQLDALRFVAIFMVLMAHWGTFAKGFAAQYDFGSMGVNLFFVISGFLITLGLLGNREGAQSTGRSLYRFYIRRFLRIFPIYYLTIALLWFFYNEKVADGIFWYLTYLSNFYVIKLQAWGGCGHFWSLAVEEQFYMVWPFVILVLPRKWILPAICVCIAFSVGIKYYWWQNQVPFWTPYTHPLGALDVLAIGGLLAWLYTYAHDKLNRILHNPLFTLFIFAQLLLCIIFKDVEYQRAIYHVGIRFSYGFFCAWLIGRAVFGFSGTMGYLLNNKFLQYVGKISYSFYLFHPFVPHMLEWLKFPGGETSRFVLYFLVTLGLSSFSWYFFESKILKLKDRFE